MGSGWILSLTVAVAPAVGQSIAQPQADPFAREGIVYVFHQEQWREGLIRVRAPRMVDGQWMWSYHVQFLEGAKELKAHILPEQMRTIQQAQDRGLTSNVYDLSSQAGIEQALNLHNSVRRQAEVSPLTWSEELAESAQTWAKVLLENNAFQHSPVRLRRRGWVGENLHQRRGQPGSSYATPQRAMAGWVDESNYYDYHTNTCAAGQQCGHYLQMVWGDSREVGCGMARADDASREVWACHYYPGGIVSHQRPY